MIFSRANIGTFFTCLAIQGCGVVTGIATARTLGPVARGELATAMLWPIILSNLGLLGCNWALAREVASDYEREADWACGAFAVGLASAFLCFILGFVLIPYLLPSEKRNLISLARLCLFLIPLDILNQVLLAIEHGRMRWRRYNFARVSFFLFYLFLICVIWTIHKAQVIWFVWAFLASHLLTVLLLLYIQKKSFSKGKLRLAKCRHLLRCGLPYFWATAADSLTLQLDKILVVSFMSSEAAGIYVVALAFAGGLSPLGDALGITSFGVLSNEKSMENREKLLTETFRHSALVSFGLGLIFSGMIPFLVHPLFGSEFSRATCPAMILVIAASLTSSSNILNEGLRGAGRPYAGLTGQLLGTAVMALAAMLFLKRFGLTGMAWAVLLGSCMQIAVLVFAAASWLRVSPFRFWPFGARNLKVFCEQLAALRLRLLRSPA
jgi:O-antigen/teichoic acid export membrane protein